MENKGIGGILRLKDEEEHLRREDGERKCLSEDTNRSMRNEGVSKVYRNSEAIVNWETISKYLGRRKNLGTVEDCNFSPYTMEDMENMESI